MRDRKNGVERVLRGERPPFARAAEAVVTADVEGLRACLRDEPDLVHARARASHHAMLLHYVSANGIESELQVAPEAIYARIQNCPASQRAGLREAALDVVRVLLDSGADVRATCDAYGRGCDVMGLLVSSAHPRDAGVQTDLVEILVNAGFPANGIRDDGAPMATALGSGYRSAAEKLRELGARVDNLLFAAGLGRGDDVRGFFDDGGELLETAAFESKTGADELATGYLSLTHSAEPGVVLQQALLLACLYDNLDAVRVLLDRGADRNAPDPHFEMTALEWSEAFNEGEAAANLRSS